MSYGDAPPSFSSTHKNGIDQDQPGEDDYNKPIPSFSSAGHGQGHSHNQFQNESTVDDTKAPSILDFGHGPHNSSVDGNNSRGLGDHYGGGQAPSISAMAKGTVSQTSDGLNLYNDPKVPSLNDVNKRRPSQNDISDQEIVMLDAPGAQELVGMSLVGPNFRKFYPNAYYKEKDGENN